MKGHPKYKLDDTVKFFINDKELVGKIYVVDKYGTFFNPTDVSYDIMVEEGECKVGTRYGYVDRELHEEVVIGPCLYKHIPETEVTLC